jgi:phosphotransacetylase
MPLASFDELYRRADALSPPVPVAVAGAADVTVLQALRSACDRGWVTPILVGTEPEIRGEADRAGISLRRFAVAHAEDPCAAAVALVRNRQARLLMKGQVSTPSLMKALLEPASGLRTDRVICQAVLIELRRDGRRLLLADTGICIQPALPQKADILRSVVELAHTLGEERPRAACLAATESPTPAMPETLDATELQRLNQSGTIPECVVRGPLSFDLAFDADAAARKKLQDPAFGVADVMLFPNLLSANLTVKAIMYTSDCRYGGMLCGAACPVVFMSRADTTATRLNSMALALNTLR